MQWIERGPGRGIEAARRSREQYATQDFDRAYGGAWKPPSGFATQSTSTRLKNRTGHRVREGLPQRPLVRHGIHSCSAGIPTSLRIYGETSAFLSVKTTTRF